MTISKDGSNKRQRWDKLGRGSKYMHSGCTRGGSGCKRGEGQHKVGWMASCNAKKGEEPETRKCWLSITFESF